MSKLDAPLFFKSRDVFMKGLLEKSVDFSNDADILRLIKKKEGNVMKHVLVEKLNVMTLVAPIIIAIIIIISQ